MAGFSPFEVTVPHIIYVGLGFFICIFSYLSLFIKERLYLGEAPIAAAFGIIVGPVAIGVFNPAKWAGESGETPGGNITDEITLEIMRVTIALSVFAVGVELPKKYLLRHWKSIAILLGPVMAWGWLITGLLIWAFVPGLDYLTSLVIAACVSPTDPILAQAVVGGPWAEKHVPAHVRHMLMCESGCNDGAAFPFLYLALYLTQNRDNTGKAIAHWFYETWAYEIILGTFLGALIGYCARKFMRFSERHKLIDRESFVAQYVSLAIASMGVNVLLGSDDLLAAFACGTAFAWDGWFTKQTEDSNFSNIVDLLFNVATFIYIGALIPWHDFANVEIGLSVWRLIVLTILVLLLKRLPIVLVMWKFIPDIKTFKEAVFSGHFGPMGVGAIFIATLGRTLMPEEVSENPETPNDVLANTIQPIVYFFVLCSILVHGLTVPFFSFGKNMHRRAHTITRTWSKHPTMPVDNEPSWMSRVRKVRPGEEIVLLPEDISAEKMTAEQLAMIGRGAIGVYQGDDMAHPTISQGETETATGDDSSGSGSGSHEKAGTYGGILKHRVEADLEKAEGTYSDGVEADGRERDAESSCSKEGDKMDGIEDWDADEHFDPSCDYLGDNCIEVRRYRERIAAQKEAARVEARKQQQLGEQQEQGELAEEEDIGEAPMDRDLITGRISPLEEDEACRSDREGQATAYHHGFGRRSSEGVDKSGVAAASERDEREEPKWPKLREWVEGHKLVIEYQRSFCDDPEVQVIPLSEEDWDSVHSSDSPSHTWLQRNGDAVSARLGHDEHRHWSPQEAAWRLFEHGIPKILGGGGGRRSTSADDQPPSRIAATAPIEETRAERDARASMLYGAMSWARDKRDEVGAPAATPRATSPRGRLSARRPSASSVSSSVSPPAPSQRKMQHSAGSAAGPRRHSLRKKVLAGQISLQGRRGSRQADVDEEEEDEFGEETLAGAGKLTRPPSSSSSARSGRPSVVISLPPSRSSSPAREKRMLPRIGQKASSTSCKGKEKYFPRSSSAGAGLAADESESGGGGMRLLRIPGRSRGMDRDPSRSSSIQWLDIADSAEAKARAKAEAEAEDGGDEDPSSTSFRRTRTMSTSGSGGGGDESGNNIAGRGVQAIGKLISAFTAPKGEGMGNPGPTSHPHLFPEAQQEQGQEQPQEGGEGSKKD